MTPITNEQAKVIRSVRKEAYGIKKMIMQLENKIIDPPCPHQDSTEDWTLSQNCTYCKVWRAAKELEDAAESLTTIMDNALLEGPIPARTP